MPVAPSPFLIGFRFTPAIDVRLSEVTIAAASLLSDVRTFYPGQSPPAEPLSSRFESSVNGVPGAALETFALADFPLFNQLKPPSSQPHLSSNPCCVSGLPYWLTAFGTDGWAVWNLNSIGHRGRLPSLDFGPCCTFSERYPNWGVSGDWKAGAGASIVLLFGTGLAALGGRRWRRR